MSELTFRRAETQDFDLMVELQNQNLATRLSEEEKQQGFLSGSFTQAQFSNLNDDIAVIVGLDESKLVGFLCASSIEFNQDFRLPAAMIARFQHVSYKGQVLSNYKSVVAGPVCVDRNYRGKGIFESMYEHLIQTVPAKYNLIAALVSTINPRSIRAHEKVGLETVDTFDFDGRTFLTMVRLVSG